MCHQPLACSPVSLLTHVIDICPGSTTQGRTDDTDDADDIAVDSTLVGPDDQSEGTFSWLWLIIH